MLKINFCSKILYYSFDFNKVLQNNSMHTHSSTQSTGMKFLNLEVSFPRYDIITQVVLKIYLFFITPSVIADIITIWCVSLDGCIVPLPIITINSLNSGANRKLVLMNKVGMKVLKRMK